MPMNRSPAIAKRSPAPQNGGSSVLLNRTARKFPPPSRTAPAKANSVKASGD
jgi:hypothetical protein